MPRPLLDIHCHYESYCDYPTMVRITMDDGTVHNYVLQNKTEYQFYKVLDSIDRLTVGYPRKRKYRRNR